MLADENESPSNIVGEQSTSDQCLREDVGVLAPTQTLADRETRLVEERNLAEDRLAWSLVAKLHF